MARLACEEEWEVGVQGGGMSFTGTLVTSEQNHLYVSVIWGMIPRLGLNVQTPCFAALPQRKTPQHLPTPAQAFAQPFQNPGQEGKASFPRLR